MIDQNVFLFQAAEFALKSLPKYAIDIIKDPNIQNLIVGEQAKTPRVRMTYDTVTEINKDGDDNKKSFSQSWNEFEGLSKEEVTYLRSLLNDYEDSGKAGSSEL